ncbi:MAG: hypothetical protein KGM15_07270 [Pseudomonadota bacterium]|nr:hypothetical protein [Pseudomonadota bacterium]
MRQKIERLRRIERLRKQMHEMSTWRLAVVAHEREKLTASHAAMLEALGEGLMAFGPVAMAGTRRVRAIELELKVADGVERDLEARVLEAGRLAKLADRSLDAARDAWREKAERVSLQELIDASIASDTASRKR